MNQPTQELQLDDPLPDGPLADGSRDRVMDAVRRFRERDATAEEQRLALAQLAGVHETLKADGHLKRAMPNPDESDLRQIANRFAIRHLNASQKSNYGPAYREWIFHAFLASIRLAYRALEEGASYKEGEGNRQDEGKDGP
jgi:hypothetical protein